MQLNMLKRFFIEFQPHLFQEQIALMNVVYNNLHKIVSNRAMPNMKENVE